MRLVTALLLVTTSVLIGSHVTCGQWLGSFGSLNIGPSSNVRPSSNVGPSPNVGPSANVGSPSCTSKSRMNSALKQVCRRDSIVNEVEARGNRIKYQNMRFGNLQLVNIQKKSYQIPPARQSCRYSAPGFFGGGRHRVTISGATLSLTGKWIKKVSDPEPSSVSGNFRVSSTLQLSTSFTVGTDYRGCAKLQNVICQPTVRRFNMVFEKSEGLTVKDMRIMRQRMRNAIGGPVCREARALVNNPGNLGSKLLG